MTGARTRRLMRDDMDRRYYRLHQFLACYLDQDWPDFYETPGKAVDAAIAEYPTELRQQARRELASVLEETSDDKQLRDILNWGLGVRAHFRKPQDARAFAEEVERKLMASIKHDFEK